jgi:hypothetical protein
MNPFEDLLKDEISSYASTMLQAAIAHLVADEEDSPQQAAWRIANALGALANICPSDASGIGKPTNLGYKLETDNDNTGSMA